MNNLILSKADEILSNRRQEYGDAHDSFGRIAAFWSAYLDIDITMADVANMMILLKVSRSKSSPRKEDNALDIIGYAVLHEILTKEAHANSNKET